MGSHTTLKGITSVGDATITEHIQVGLKFFFNWGLLNAGGFFNIRTPASGQYGGSRHRLRVVDDPNFTDGRVWESFKKEWVWESGVEHTLQPIQVSGVYVGGSYYPSDSTGTYAHHVDYPNGRIVFDTAVPASSVVTAEYSYRWAPCHFSDEPWFQQIQFRSFRNDDTNFTVGSGGWGQLAQNRVQLPAIVIDMSTKQPPRGLELGGGEIVTQEVIFHVLSENAADNKRLRDIITAQDPKNFYLFNLNKLADNNRFPLTVNGSIASGAPSYPQLVAPASDNPSVSGFRYYKATLQNMNAPQMVQVSSNLYWSAINTEVEVDIPAF